MVRTHLHYYILTLSFIIVKSPWVDHGNFHIRVPISCSWNHVECFVTAICFVSFQCDGELSIIQLQECRKSLVFALKISEKMRSLVLGLGVGSKGKGKIDLVLN